MLSRFFARRYFFSRHTRNAVNLISLISVLGYAFGTMALIIVLSVFNGFDTVVNTLYNSYDPDLKIVPARGKFFEAGRQQLNLISKTAGVKAISRVLEENALVRYGPGQSIATLKGVDKNYFSVSGVATTISLGDSTPWATPDFAMVGRGLAGKLSVDFGSMEPLEVFMPDAEGAGVLNPEGAFTKETIYPSHEFAIQQEIDGKNMIVPLAFAQKLLQDETRLSSIEICLQPDANPRRVQLLLTQKLGSDLVVKNRYEQHELLNRIMKSEKQVSYIILCLILLVASFNMVASLIMLVLEKQDNIRTLFSMGATRRLVGRIFLAEGMLITTVGTAVGLALGGLLCWLQMKYGIIKIAQADTLVIDSYPVALNAADFVAVAATALLVGVLTAAYPAHKASRQHVLG